MSISDRITSMSNNLSDAYDGIEYLGVDTTGVDKNLQNLASMLNVVYEGLPKVYNEGVSPSIVGSRVGRLKSMLKASDTTQESTTGKNKFSGFTFGIALNNSTGAAFSSNVASTSDYIPVDFDTNSSYFLSGLTDTLHSNIWAYNSSKQGLGRTGNVVRTAIELKPTSFTNGTPQGTGDIAYIRVCQRIDGTDTGDPSKVNELATQLETGNSETDYEPYTGGIPSPNPNYPQDIHVVKGNNTVEVCGKNLFNKTTAIDGKRLGSDGMPFSDNDYCLSDFIVAMPSVSYTYSRYSSGGGSAAVAFYDKNKTFISRILWGSSAFQVQTFTTPADTKYLRITDFKTLKDNMQLEKGSTSTTYGPYNGTAYPINLPVQNLFDKDNANILNNTYIGASTLGTSYGAKTLYINCQPNTTYTISKTASQRFIVGDTNTTPASSVAVSNRTADNTGTSITITTSADAKYLVVFYYLSTADTLTEQQIRDSIQIEPGNKANRYTPYGVTPIELCKIGDYQDKLFKAVVGDTVYDSLTSEQKEDLVSGGWYKYEEMPKVVLDGVNTKFSQKSASTANVIWMTTADYDISTYNTNIICNYFKKATSSVIYNNSMLGVYTENNRIKCGFGIDTQLTTLELANEWLKTHNVIVYLPYGEPQIIPITDTTLISQLENLYSAMSKNGQTNVLQTNADVPFTIFASALKGE